jgi:hypothetical protein
MVLDAHSFEKSDARENTERLEIINSISLPQLCRKPTPFFHDPSRYCTIYPIEKSSRLGAPF